MSVETPLDVAEKSQTITEDFFQAFGAIYTDIAEIDLTNESVWIAKSSSNPEMTRHTLPFAAILGKFAESYVAKVDRERMLESFSLDALRLLMHSGAQFKKLDVRILKGQHHEWVEITAIVIPGAAKPSDRIIVCAANITSQKLLKGVVDRFVYDNCDFFLHVNSANDSYIMFHHNDNGTPLPARNCNIYSVEMADFLRNHAAAEDIERAAHETSLPVVLAALEANGEHNLTCGIQHPARGYTRKLIKYVYYDKVDKTILVSCNDITISYAEEQRRNSLLQNVLKEAQTDSLTGLYNHKTTRTLISEWLAEDASRSNAAFIFIDVDNFKQVNDKLGHQNGDLLLKKLGEGLTRVVRKYDIAGRVGGDEFIAFLTGITNLKHIEICAERICGLLRDFEMPELGGLNISCSVGVAIYPQDGTDYATLAQKSDKALYQAKAKGKNCFSFYLA